VEAKGRLRGFWNLRNLMDPDLTPGDPLWIGKSKRDWGPRFGFAYSPLDSGTLAVRGGFGIMYLANDPNVYRNTIGRTVRNNPELDFSLTPAINFFPDALATIAAYRALGRLGSNVAIQYNNFKTPHSLQYNLNIQQQIGAANMVAIGFAGSRGINNTSFGDFNIPNAVYDGVSLMYPVGAQRSNLAFEAANYTSTNANSWYNAMTVSVARRAAAGLTAQLAYTWAKATSISDTAQRAEYSGGGAATLIYPHDLSTHRGRSGYHIGQAFNFSYAYDLPFGGGMSGAAGRLLSGWQVTGIFRVQDGQPFNPGRSTPSAINGIASGTRPNRDLSVPWDKITSGTTAGCPGVAAGRKLGTPDLYFDPCAFSLPTTREIGNLGKGAVLSPSRVTWDMGVTKETSITERWRLQVRAEAFNVMNRANFGNPSSNIFTAGGGRPATTGRITSTNSPNRQMQFSLKLLF
jgi:hypothetical protein